MRGTTFLLPIPSPTSKHLFVLLTSPIIVEEGRAEKALLVSFSSIRLRIPYDNTCIVSKGEHRFLRQKSYVNYRHARIESVEYMETSIRSEEVQPMDSIEGELLDLICEGLLNSLKLRKKLGGCTSAQCPSNYLPFTISASFPASSIFSFFATSINSTVATAIAAASATVCAAKPFAVS